MTSRNAGSYVTAIALPHASQLRKILHRPVPEVDYGPLGLIALAHGGP